jgi:hypothetical protein
MANHAGVETTSFQEIFYLQVTFGLDTCTALRLVQCRCTVEETTYSTNGVPL